jgi:hypothetical protein
MSWPDLHFHTQFLTADKTDPRVFRRAGLAAALAAYEIADAGPDEALLIAEEVAARSSLRLASISQRAVREMANLDPGVPDATGQIAHRARRDLDHALRRDRSAIASVNALLPNQPPAHFAESLADLDGELERQAQRAAKRMELALQAVPAPRSAEAMSSEGLHSSVLQRRQDGPGTALSDLWLSYPEQILLAEELAAHDPQVIFCSLHPIGDEYWNMIDGRRTVMEIAEAVCSEFGFNFDPALLLPLARGLVRAGLASAVPAGEKVDRTGEPSTY